MIFLDSRYADGTLLTAHDARTGKYQVTVFREFPAQLTGYFYYNWVETDRLDLLALRFLGKANLWWKILDINPNILDPSSINAGVQLRIPSA